MSTDTVSDYGLTRDQAWDLYFENHPDVLANWGHQNGRWPQCPCPQCDPDQLLPRPDICVDDK